ncbi:hypothetical protein DPMN_041018 [Dreissena polymorpha]|uniref:Uncharacterized protein n=1 Tax=Dreissena polymorpha TaxID=45954 RepID=A0A9D4CXS8_DREPO|nr:hypothetical protein DPMN_041018 [Dreissena polymorpha]
MCKTVLQGTLEGGRHRGRQKKNWIDNVFRIVVPHFPPNGQTGQGIYDDDDDDDDDDEEEEEEEEEKEDNLPYLTNMKYSPKILFSEVKLPKYLPTAQGTNIPYQRVFTDPRQTPHGYTITTAITRKSFQIWKDFCFSFHYEK